MRIQGSSIKKQLFLLLKKVDIVKKHTSQNGKQNLNIKKYGCTYFEIPLTKI